MAKANKTSKLKVTVEGDYLVIRIPAAKNPPPSKSGKSLMVASTQGIKRTGCQFNGAELSLGLNAFIPAEDE